MTKKILLIALLIGSMPLYVNAQDSNREPEEIIKDFFNTYKEQSTDAALEYIFSTNPWMKDSKSQVDELMVKLKNTIQIMGEFYSERLISKSSVGSDLVTYSYLVKYDRQPLRFIFMFYKPNNSWRLQNFKYDDSIDEELEEALRAYRLTENLSRNR